MEHGSDPLLLLAGTASLAPAQITHARKLIEAGERVEDVAALWNVGRTTLYRALAG